MATQLRVAELDFDLIKENLKEFLRSKPEFTDYDYEGSALSVLIDLLSYNTHYNAVIGNMLIQELYLDTAVKKQSLALIAKRLGYLPKSYRAPRAVVTLEVFPYDQPATLTLNKNSKFTTRLSYSENAFFSNRSAVTINRSATGRYIFENIEIFEGDATTFRYIVSDAAVQKFEIPSRLVDTSLVRVFVQDSVGGTTIEEWKNFNTLIDINANTNAFFIKLNENLNYEVYFGDGVLGKSISPGNVVIIDYVTTNGPIANNASSFTLTDTVNGYTNSVVTTVTPAYGGAVAESNDSIRRNAQNTVLLQNRAVTESDYIAIINQIIPVDTVAVYGGETVTPPQYGKVFISVKQIGTTLPLLQSQKDAIVKEIKRRSMMSLVHEFVDPQYTYLIIDTQVKFNTSMTSSTVETLSTNIFNGIRTYATDNLNTFNSSFEYSDLVGYIDNIDRAIISNDTVIRLRKEASFVYGADNVYMFDFSASLKQSNSKEQNIKSNVFRSSSYPDADLYIDDVDGIIRFYTLGFNQKIIVVENAGTVDYATGKISFNLNAYVATSEKLTIEAMPSNRNILPSRNNIITLAEQDILIGMIAA